MGSRKTVDGVEDVYGAADRWVDSALRLDDSLFTPGKPIWSAGWLAELRNRFLDQPDVGDGDFLSKLSSQLEGSPPEVYQLMGEVLYAHFLIIWKGGMGAEAKKDRIEQVLGWGAPVSCIPADLIDGLAPGIARSEALMVQRPYQAAFIIEFVEQWKEEASNLREHLLSDPWAFKDFVSQMPFRSRLLGDSPNRPGAQREALMHLVHPDGFEGTVSISQKDEIASAKVFAHYITEETPDVDRKLRQIRLGLESGLGRDFDFYDRDIRDWWDPSPSGLWDRYIEIASRFHDSGLMWSHELKYKLEIGEKLSTAREAIHNGAEDWADLVKKGITGNLVHRVTLAKFRDWLKDFPEDAMRALKALWTPYEVSVSERIPAFCDGFPSSAIGGAGTRMNVISQLLMGLDPEKYPPYRVTTFDKAYRLAGYAQRPDDADEAAQYEHALGFLDRFIEEARSRGLPVRHRLDAQSLVWQVPLQSPEPSDVEVPEAAAMDLSTLSESLRLSEEFLRNIETLLYDKRQVIFQGPPGTGKTYVAQALAEHLAGPEGSTTLVQFHPSYAYEDFVHGFPSNGDRWTTRVRASRRSLAASSGAGTRRAGRTPFSSYRRDQPRQPRQSFRRTVLPVGIPGQGDAPPVLGRTILATRKPPHSWDDEHGRPFNSAGGPGIAPPVLLRRVPPGRRSGQGRSTALAARQGPRHGVGGERRIKGEREAERRPTCGDWTELLHEGRPRRRSGRAHLEAQCPAVHPGASVWG